MRRLRECFGLMSATATMCAFGSPYLKFFGIVAPPRIEAELRWLDEKRFTRGGALAAHQPERDRDFTIRSHAQLAGRYPHALNTWIIAALVSSAPAPRAGEGLAVQLNTLKGEHEGGGEWSSSESERSEGGAEEHIVAARRDTSGGLCHIRCRLDPVVRKRVETA